MACSFPAPPAAYHYDEERHRCRWTSTGSLNAMLWRSEALTVTASD
jgi:hypothetical protein